MNAADNKVEDLKLAAPAVHAALCRLDTESCDASIFQLAFLLSCQNGGLGEGTVRRTPGASFNPKPARICHILLNECRETRSEVLCAALLISSSAQPPFPSSLAAAGEILEASRGLFDNQEGIGAPAQRVALAHHLDVLRHAHMSAFSNEEQRRLVECSKNILAKSFRHPENERLYVLIEAWLNRQVDKGDK